MHHATGNSHTVNHALFPVQVNGRCCVLQATERSLTCSLTQPPHKFNVLWALSRATKRLSYRVPTAADQQNSMIFPGFQSFFQLFFLSFLAGFVYPFSKINKVKWSNLLFYVKNF